MAFFLVLHQVELSRELHSPGSTHKLSEKLFVALLHVSAQSEPRVENILTDGALKIGIKLAMELMLVFDTAGNI